MLANFRSLLCWTALGCAGIVQPSFATAVFELIAGDCQTPTQLRVAAMPASAVLDRLGQAFGFSVSFRADTDPLLDAEITAPLAELLMQLTAQMNVITVTELDPKCSTAPRVSRLVTLPVGEETQRIEAVPEGLQRYRRAHGMDPITGTQVPRK